MNRHPSESPLDISFIQPRLFQKVGDRNGCHRPFRVRKGYQSRPGQVLEMVMAPFGQHQEPPALLDHPYQFPAVHLAPFHCPLEHSASGIRSMAIKDTHHHPAAFVSFCLASGPAARRRQQPAATLPMCRSTAACARRHADSDQGQDWGARLGVGGVRAERALADQRPTPNPVSWASWQKIKQKLSFLPIGN